MHRPLLSSQVPKMRYERGNARGRVFFGGEDYEPNRDLLSSQRSKQGVAV